MPVSEFVPLVSLCWMLTVVNASFAQARAHVPFWCIHLNIVCVLYVGGFSLLSSPCC